MIKLTKRQRSLVECIDKCNVLADVGCDHGYIGLSAIMQCKTEKLFLLDISNPSLNKAATHAKQYNLSSQNITTICQDGLGDVQCDCAVIAGMGALEMIGIIDRATFKPQTLVLQPMRNAIELREYLIANNYIINCDFTIHDGKFYDIIVANKSSERQLLSNLELAMGLTNIANPTEDYILFVSHQLAKYNKLATLSSDESVLEKLQMLQLAQKLLER